MLQGLVKSVAKALFNILSETIKHQNLMRPKLPICWEHLALVLLTALSMLGCGKHMLWTAQSAPTDLIWANSHTTWCEMPQFVRQQCEKSEAVWMQGR